MHDRQGPSSSFVLKWYLVSDVKELFRVCCVWPHAIDFKKKTRNVLSVSWIQKNEIGLTRSLVCERLCVTVFLCFLGPNG